MPQNTFYEHILTRLIPLVVFFAIRTPFVTRPILLTPSVVGLVILTPGIIRLGTLAPFIVLRVILTPSVVGLIILTPGIVLGVILSPIVVCLVILPPTVVCLVVLTPIIVGSIVLTPTIVCSVALAPIIPGAGVILLPPLIMLRIWSTCSACSTILVTNVRLFTLFRYLRLSLEDLDEPCIPLSKPFVVPQVSYGASPCQCAPLGGAASLYLLAGQRSLGSRA